MATSRIVIVGGGLVGSTLAAKLARDGFDVALIERDAKQVRELSEALDTQVLQGNGATVSCLRRAGIEKANLVLAATNSDEVNLAVAFLASFLFKTPRIITRLRNPEHTEGFELIHSLHPADYILVNPEAAAVDRIFSLLEVPGAIDVVSFLDAQLLVAGFRIAPHSDFVGLRVSDLQLMFAQTPTVVVAINRREDWIIPHGDEEIHNGDLVYFAIARSDLQGVLELVGSGHARRNKIVVAGAGWIGLEVARRLEKTDYKVVLLEEDALTAQRASDELKDTIVIQGSATDPALLEEESIEEADTFVAVTQDYEDNLVAGLLAKRMGAGRAFVMLDNPSLVHLIGEIGIDAVISPRQLAIGLTLKHVRGHTVRSVAALLEDRVEIFEVDVAAGSPLTARRIAELGLPRGILIGGLLRAGKLTLPRGDDRILPADRVIFVTKPEQSAKLATYLAG